MTAHIHINTGGSSGGEGTTDYNKLQNKPSINGVTLQGSLLGHDIGLANKDEFDALSGWPAPYDPATVYLKGDLVVYEGIVYEAPEDFEDVAGEFDKKLWNAIENLLTCRETAEHATDALADAARAATNASTALQRANPALVPASATFEADGTFSVCLEPSEGGGGPIEIQLLADAAGIVKSIVVGGWATTLEVRCGADGSVHDGNYTVGDVIRLHCDPVSGAAYEWTGPNGWRSSARNSARGNCTMEMAGIYTCVVTLTNGRTISKAVEVSVKAQGE